MPMCGSVCDHWSRTFRAKRRVMRQMGGKANPKIVRIVLELKFS
jgi:hypothetical protein